MIKLNYNLVQRLTTYGLLLSLAVTNQAATIIQNPKLANMNDGFLEIKPNGSLILRSSLHNTPSSVWQEALILQAILSAIRSRPLQTKNTLNELNEKMYGEGDEHKFPPFLERVIQRIQTYFSIYKYTDTSEPIRDDLPTSSTTAATAETAAATIDTATTTSPLVTTHDIVNATLTLSQQNEIHVSVNGGSYYDFDNQPPLETSTSSSDTTEKPTEMAEAAAAAAAGDEENEFIEIKYRKSLDNKKL